jgi:hypothetical protein
VGSHLHLTSPISEPLHDFTHVGELRVGHLKLRGHSATGLLHVQLAWSGDGCQLQGLHCCDCVGVVPLVQFLSRFLFFLFLRKYSEMHPDIKKKEAYHNNSEVVLTQITHIFR